MLQPLLASPPLPNTANGLEMPAAIPGPAPIQRSKDQVANRPILRLRCPDTAQRGT
ncbi:MAG TPA: hypothetical protein VF662_08385 [Allosphingosinicella sp.]|jgi:hypothetical protein